MTEATRASALPKTPDRTVPFTALALFLLTGALFARVLTFPFVQWDDDINLYRNPNLGGLDWPRLVWMVTDWQYVKYYAPLGWLSAAVIYEFSGLNPWGYHLSALLQHALNVALAFLLLRRLLAAATRVRGHEASAAALTCGAAHCMAMLFLLLSALAYLRAVEAGDAGRTGRGWYWASVAAFVASLLSYPVGLGFVAALVALDFFPLRRFGEGRGGWRDPRHRSIWLEKLPFVAAAGMAVALSVYRRFHTGWIWTPPAGMEEFTPLARVMQAFYLWAYYLWKPCAPFGLSPYYSTLVSFEPLSRPFVLSAALVLGLSAALWRRRGRWPGLGLVWACHLVLLVPVLGLFEYPHYPSDRYNYVASLVWSIVIGTALVKWWPAAKFRLALGAVAVIVAALAVASVRLSGIWRSSEGLFDHMLAALRADDPNRAEIHYHRGTLFANEGQLDRAGAEFQTALRIRATPAMHHALGLVLERQQKFADALAQYRLAAQGGPDAGVWRRLAAVAGRLGLNAEAIQAYRAWLQLQPDSPEGLNNLAWLLATDADARNRNGAEAVRLAERACALTGGQVPVLLGTLAAAYAEAGRFNDALAAAQQARALAEAAGDREVAEKNRQLLELYRKGQPYREAK
jgi:tetratricopeptide (TPR) repeat protein